jgi:hypothetical protein
MCDEQAGKRFRERKPGSLDSYSSHYDSTVNVCYFRVHEATTAMDSLEVHDVVFDAFGGRVYANFISGPQEGKKHSEVPPYDCGIYIPSKPIETCHSDLEFDELTEKYFGVLRPGCRVLLGILGGCDSQKTVSAAEPTTPKPADARPLFTPEAASLAQQKMCDEQAGKRFRERTPGSLDSYTSHYDCRVNVCYTRQRAWPPNDVVFDAFGGRVYASYIWNSPEVHCEIYIPGKPTKTCHSDKEFDELTEKYFGLPPSKSPEDDRINPEF